MRYKHLQNDNLIGVPNPGSRFIGKQIDILDNFSIITDFQYEVRNFCQKTVVLSGLFDSDVFNDGKCLSTRVLALS
jgi:hypothetical protein